MAKKIIIEDVELGNSGEVSKNKINKNFDKVDTVLDDLDRETVKKVDTTTTLGFSTNKIPTEKAVSGALKNYPTKSEVIVGTILKGEKNNVLEIKAITNPRKGDTYKAKDTGHYWSYLGENGSPYNSGYWSDLGEIIPKDIDDLAKYIQVVTTVDFLISLVDNDNNLLLGISRNNGELIINWESCNGLIALINKLLGVYINVISNSLYSFLLLDEANNILFFIDRAGNISDPSGLQILANRMATVEKRMTAVENSAGMLKAKIWSPKNIYSLISTKTQVFKCGLIYAYNVCNWELNINVVSGTAKGYNRDAYYEYTPVEIDMPFEYTFVGKSDRETITAANTTKIIPVKKGISPANNKNILLIGDSFVEAGYFPTELKRMLTGTGGNPVADELMNITFIGTKNKDTVAREGYSGKHYKFFSESDSPFWDSVLNDIDFTSYCARNGFAAIDYVVIHLGTNGNYTEANISHFWNRLKEHNPDIKVLILGRCFAVPYGTGMAGMSANQTWLSFSSTTQAYNQYMQDFCEREAYNNNFLYVDYNVLLDNLNNMPYQEVNANTRNTTAKIRLATDNVHPAPSGYYQIADAVRAAFHYWCLNSNN